MLSMCEQSNFKVNHFKHNALPPVGFSTVDQSQAKHHSDYQHDPTDDGGGDKRDQLVLVRTPGFGAFFLSRVCGDFSWGRRLDGKICCDHIETNCVFGSYTKRLFYHLTRN